MVSYTLATWRFKISRLIKKHGSLVFEMYELKKYASM